MFNTYFKIILINLLLLCFGTSAQVWADTNKKFTVVIDAGHGGKDVGATDNGVMEKNINLKVAKQLENLIKKKMKNVNVIMTRDNDTYLTLQQRADIANKSQGDIFISIHTNSVDKRNKNRKTLEGSSFYTLGLHKDANNLEVAMRENSVIELENDYEQKYSGFDPQRDESYIIFEMAQKKNLSQSIKFAENLEKEFEKKGRKSRGVHQAGFWVLWASSMPSVLVELDFICNPQSANYLTSDKGAKDLAEAIFKALQKYEDSWNKSKLVTNNELSDTYIDNSSSILEDTYISTETYATAKTRTKKSGPIKKNPVVTSSGERRRRSARARDISNSRSFEDNSLVFQSGKEFSSITEWKEEEEILIAENVEKQSKDKGKNKKKKNDNKKQKENNNKNQRKKDAHNAKVNKLVTVYKIQLLASSDLLNQNNQRFCGLTPISTFKENNLYKYYYGESSDKAEIEALLADVKKKIPDAFIVTSQKTVKK